MSKAPTQTDLLLIFAFNPSPACLTSSDTIKALTQTEAKLPPPLLSCPTPCPSRGGGGRHLVNTKFFCYGSLCCCVGDWVVRHCHLYPLFSSQDILLTLAEMELDSTTMFTPVTNVMFIRSTGETVLVQVVAYSYAYSEHGDAYRPISHKCEGKTVLPLILSFCTAIFVPENVRVWW